MKSQIKARARELGFDDCRIASAEPPTAAAHFERWISAGWHGEMDYLRRNAPKRVDPELVLPGAKSILTLATSYHLAEAEGEEGPRTGVLARYARFQDYHRVIGDQLAHLTKEIAGGSDSTKSLWYVDTGPILERDHAQRSGLGFVGKHTNLISRRLGNWIFLSEIITTLPLEPDASEQNYCGSCTRCLTACPTEAIRAPFQLDARRCISYLTIELKGSIPVEFRRAIGNRIYGCDDCLEVCPWNRFAQEGRLMRRAARSELGAMDLVELLDLDQAEFDRRFRGTPIQRAKRTGLLRNACVALGNVGGSEALAPLEKLLAQGDAVLSEHAGWAIEEIKIRAATTG